MTVLPEVVDPCDPHFRPTIKSKHFGTRLIKHLVHEGGGEKCRFPRLTLDTEFIEVSLGKLMILSLSKYWVNREPLNFQAMESNS